MHWLQYELTLMFNSTIVCSVIVPASLLEPLLWRVAVECCVSSSTSLGICTIVPQSDSESTITYQVQVLDPTIPRPRCMLECTHKLFGSSLCPQPNAVIILASTKRPTQILQILVTIPSYVYISDGYNQGVGEAGGITEIILLRPNPNEFSKNRRLPPTPRHHRLCRLPPPPPASAVAPKHHS